jgi:hypothetical protein
VVAKVRTAVVADATCCGSVAAAALPGSSLVVAAVPPVTLGALDERRLVGMDASDLSALAGARGGDGRRHPTKTKTKRLDSCPEIGAPRGAIAYLKVEAPLPFPRGLDGRCGGGRRRHCRAPPLP